MFILFQENESDNLIKPFTDLQLAVDYALKDIMVFDGVEGEVELCEENSIVAIISSDCCESPYVVFDEEVDQINPE